MRKAKGFTLLEIMIVVLVIGVLISIAIPNFISSRAKARARTCGSNLRQILQAKEQFAMANSLTEGIVIVAEDLQPTYIKGSFPTCPSGGVYTVGVVGDAPTCSKSSENPPHTVYGN